MVNISIDVTDLGGEAHPGDKIVLWRPRVGGSATHAGRVISTAPHTVFLEDGRATVPDAEPGEMRVLLQCRGFESQEPIPVVVPDGTGVVTLRALLESQFEYSPPVVSAVQQAADNAAASERAAIQAQVRSERAADRADAKVDDAINNGANLIRDEVKQDADRAVSARQAAIQSESKAKASESAAATSESNAAASESAAKQSETNAGDFAAVATTAATEAVDAMESATNIASSIADSVEIASRHATGAAQSESGAAAYAQNASDAADRIGTAEQVGAWASETSEASARAESAALNAEASENNAQTAASEIRNRTPVLVRGKTTRDLKDAIEESIRIYPDTTNNNRAVYLPAGDYLVEPDAFSDIDMSGTVWGIRNGVKFTGDGKGATRLILQTNGEESWFYDNKSVSNRFFQELTFEGITFMADSMEYGNGFKQWSSGGEKRFRFINCGFDLNTVLHTLGTGNADLNRFENCRVVANTTVILENPQSVANGFHNCDFTVRKSLVKMIRGGSFWVTMGNLEMWQADGDDGSEMHYLIDASDSVLAADGSLEFNLTDVRFEVHGINKGLVSVNDGAAGVMQANFTRCTWGSVFGGVREVVRIGSASRVTFDNCVLHRDFRYVAATTMTNLSAGAMIEFNRCYIGRGERLWEQCETVGDQARIIARGCFRQSLATSASIRNPQDFDMGWRTSPSYAVLPEVKTVSLKRPSQAMPTPRDSSGDLRARLPVGAYLKRLYFHSGPNVNMAGSYQLHIGSTDKSEVYASSEEAEASEGVDIEIRDIGFSGDQETRIWATGTVNSFWTGGESSVAFLEYI